MIVECPSCHTRYKVDDSKVLGKKIIKFRCKKCGHVFQQTNPLHTNLDEEETAQVSRKELIGDGSSNLPEDKDYFLFILKGAREGYKYKIDKAYTVIGRGSAADLIIPDLEVSRKHCAIEISDDKALLRDLNSTNGTYINNEKISVVEIKDQTEFKIGQTLILFMESPKKRFEF